MQISMNGRRGKMRYIDFACKLIFKQKDRVYGSEGVMKDALDGREADPSLISHLAFSEDVLGKVSTSHLSWQFVTLTHFLAMRQLHSNLIFRTSGCAQFHQTEINASERVFGPLCSFAPRTKIIYKAERRHVQLQDTATKSHTSKVTLRKVTL